MGEIKLLLAERSKNVKDNVTGFHTGKPIKTCRWRLCKGCKDRKPRTDYSDSQWKKGKQNSRCKSCIVAAKKAEAERRNKTKLGNGHRRFLTAQEILDRRRRRPTSAEVVLGRLLDEIKSLQ